MKLQITLILLIVSTVTVFAQQTIDPLKQTITFKIDQLGNSEVEAGMQLNASQWDYYKRNTGSNVAVLKRDMERALPTMFLKDFQYEEQPMERKYTLKFKALGVSKLKEKNKWVVDLESENPDITPLSENIYLMTSNLIMNGGLIQQSIKIFLPDKAKNIKVEKNSFGSALFTYQLNNTFSGSVPFLLIIGFVLILTSLVLFFLPRLKTAVSKLF